MYGRIFQTWFDFFRQTLYDGPSEKSYQMSTRFPVLGAAFFVRNLIVRQDYTKKSLHNGKAQFLGSAIVRLYCLQAISVHE
jgi:hypothetical protein